MGVHSINSVITYTALSPRAPPPLATCNPPPFLFSASNLKVYEHRRVELKFVYEYRLVLVMRIEVSATLVIFMGIECASLLSMMLYSFNAVLL